MAPKFVASYQVNAVLREWKLELETDFGSKMSSIFYLLYLTCPWGIQIEYL